MEVKNKKVLMISYVPTHPQDAGNKRRVFENAELLRELGCEIDFLYYRSGLGDDIKLMKEYFGNQHFYLVNSKGSSTRNHVKNQIRKFLSEYDLDKKLVLHYDVDERYHESIGQLALKLHGKNKYDCIFVEYVMYSKCLECFDDTVVKVIDTHDRFSDREKLFQKNGEKPTFFYTTKREERRGLSRADVVIAIQEQERRFFEKLLIKNNTRVCTVGQRISCVKLPLVNENALGFIGSDNALNIQGIRWFIAQVLPEIKLRVPDIKLYIAGNVCRMLPDSTDYIKMGRVENLTEFYEKVRVVINPVLSGTGLNIKSIEAIAYTKPMVTTTVGAKGLRSKRDIFMVADEEDKYANHICSLLRDDEVCLQLMQNCEMFTCQYNNKVIKTMKQVMD